MTLRQVFLWFWVGGLALFGIVIALGMPLVLTEVPGGILDHQAAGTGAEVNRIQAAWDEAGLVGQARVAMVGDLVFIGIYGLGCVLGGLYFRSMQHRRFRALGTAAAFAGGLFLLSDYVETFAQFAQLSRGEGNDALAGLAAQVRPIKIASWIVATIAIIGGLLAEWRAHRRA